MARIHVWCFGYDGIVRGVHAPWISAPVLVQLMECVML
jgi:hypothetical protein